MDKRGWIGVDLDKTLAEYHGWVSEEHIGPPIPAMIQRVKGWLEEGREVRIFTARVDGGQAAIILGDTNGEKFRDVTRIKSFIEAWCVKHLGTKLPVTNMKDYGMIELWDDRCVQIEPNTGYALQDRVAELEASLRQEGLVSDRLRLSWREDVEAERRNAAWESEQRHSAQAERNAAVAENARLREAVQKEIKYHCQLCYPYRKQDGLYVGKVTLIDGIWWHPRQDGTDPKAWRCSASHIHSALSTPPVEHGAEEGREAQREERVLSYLLNSAQMTMEQVEAEMVRMGAARAPEQKENLICALCGSPVDWREAEQVYRHTGPVSDDRYIAQTVCDKYGYPVEAIRAKEEPNA